MEIKAVYDIPQPHQMFPEGMDIRAGDYTQAGFLLPSPACGYIIRQIDLIGGMQA